MEFLNNANSNAGNRYQLLAVGDEVGTLHIFEVSYGDTLACVKGKQNRWLGTFSLCILLFFVSSRCLAI